MDILLIAFLTFLSGVFSMTEMAVVSSRRVRLETLAQAGDRGARAVLTLLGNAFAALVALAVTAISRRTAHGSVAAAELDPLLPVE